MIFKIYQMHQSRNKESKLAETKQHWQKKKANKL